MDSVERRELIRRLVLDTISDDYENVDQIILRDVAQDGAKLGLNIERFDVVEALAGLVGAASLTAISFVLVQHPVW